MDIYQKKILEIKNKNWKKSFISKIEGSKQIHSALSRIIDEYIYGSKNIREIKSRIRKIIGHIEGELVVMTRTRKDLEENKLNKIKIILKDIRKKLRKLKWQL